ncbi:MAG: hypothetical protein ACKVOK_08285 [Flavobacteriales bacterium]
MKYMSLSIFLVALCLSCRHDTLVEPPLPDPCPNGFEQIFGFINHGDTTVKIVDLDSKTYHVNTNLSHYDYTQYRSIQMYPDAQYPLSDSLIHRSYDCVEPDSYKWMLVKITQKNPDGAHIRISTWELDTTDWVYMYEPEDFTEFFHWPEDTLRYIKTDDWYPE